MSNAQYPQLARQGAAPSSLIFQSTFLLLLTAMSNHMIQADSRARDPWSAPIVNGTTTT
jgi:hypothetical protein